MRPLDEVLGRSRCCRRAVNDVNGRGGHGGCGGHRDGHRDRGRGGRGLGLRAAVVPDAQEDEDEEADLDEDHQDDDDGLDDVAIVLAVVVVVGFLFVGSAFLVVARVWVTFWILLLRVRVGLVLPARVGIGFLVRIGVGVFLTIVVAAVAENFDELIDQCLLIIGIGFTLGPSGLICGINY